MEIAMLQGMNPKSLEKEAERQRIIDKRKRVNPRWWRVYTHLVASSTGDLKRVARQLEKL